MNIFSKKIAAFILNLFILSSLFASRGIMAGEGKIHMVQTEWFDIIYGDESENSAMIMYQNADGIYQELADMYGWKEPPCRMPVILTTQVEVFNAYFTTGNYNHIVLYVTNGIESLVNQPDNLLWTFRHELTHAFTYNMKSIITRGWTTVFGDSSTFHAFTVTPGVAEGATLTSESIEGNGRLNDEFTKQYVKQAKLESKFPKYNDVQGSRDIYPKGCFYHFNGAFHEYLQNKYGLEKYAKFWYNCINNSISTRGAFRKAYKVKLIDEWNAFAASYSVPDIPGDPLKAGLAKDFFKPLSSEYSLENKKGAIVSSLSQSAKGITYIDEKTDKVFFVSNQDLQKDNIKPTELFQFPYLNGVTQSLDGKYITLSYYDAKDNNYRTHIAIYDTDTKKWYKPAYHGVKEGIVVKKGADYYLVALHFKGEESNVHITKLNRGVGGEIIGEEEVASSAFPRTQYASSFIPVKNGTFAFILKSGLKFSVQLMNVDGQVLAEYKSPELKNFVMHYLSVDSLNSDELYFSWVMAGTMPRAGKINLSNGEYILAQEDLSGGIYYPVKYNDEFLYVGEFFDYNKVFRKSDVFASVERYQSEINNNDENLKESSLLENNEKSPLSLHDIATVKPYNPFRYTRGTFIPLSQAKSTSYDTDHRGSYGLPFGITYMTNNPWDSIQYIFTGGYGTETNSTGFEFTVSGATDTSNFTWNSTLFTEFDGKGWKAGDVKAKFGFNFGLGNLNLQLSPSVLFHAGRSNAGTSYMLDSFVTGLFLFDLFPFQNVGFFGNHDDLFYLYGESLLIARLTNVSKVYDNRWSYKGFDVGFIPSYTISYETTKSAMDFNVSDVTLFGLFYIPRLIPIECVNNATYNLPVKLFASAFNTRLISSNFIFNISSQYSDIPYPNLAMVGGEIVLFAKEIQKSLRFFPIFYFNDIYLSALGTIGYDYYSHAGDNFGIQYTNEFIKEIIDGQNKLIGSVALKLSIGMNPVNFGSLARSDSKNYICIVPTIVFTGEGKPIVRTAFSFDVRF